MNNVLKIPVYWLELFNGLEDREIGIIFCFILSCLSGSLSDQCKAVRKAHTLSEKGARVFDICLDDIRYQQQHSHAYRKPENVVAIRNSQEYRAWRAAVYERDNYTCQNCGAFGGVLNAHHIKPFSRFPELRFELSNGITLCKECHKKAHERGFRNA